jgi:hypothetical protein
MAAGIRKDGESFADYRARLNREQAQMDAPRDGNGRVVVNNRASRRAQYAIARRRRA